ncbi:MAG TPA: sulfotransferase [Woeseiaceae bacterium]|nr:sulfotransferase [Woeseiaceae bacterium]
MGQLSTSKGRFDEVLELVDRGEYAHAEGLCRALLQKYPRDVNLVGLRGAVLIKLERPEEAEQALKQAIRLAPTFAKPYEDLGHALLELKRPREAAAALRSAVRLDPKLEQGWFKLGRALAMLGLGSEADEAFEKSFALNPERGQLALAAEHHKEGRLEEAERIYRRIIRANPKNADAIRMLGRVALSAKRNADAERLFRRAMRLAPGFTGAMTDLARMLKEQNRFDEAIALLEEVIRLGPGNPQTHLQLAATLAPAALTWRAIDEYEKALELSPKFAGARLGLGHVLKTVGRQEEAIAAYRECIRLRPDNGESYWSLANLKTYSLSDEDIAAMEKRLARDDLTRQSRVNFLFAMAKAMEDRGEFDRAWHYYVEGNGIQRRHEKYDPVTTEVMHDALIEVFDRELLEKNTGLGNEDASPIFVVGLPRSGSTLIEQILASHSTVEGTSELPYVGRVATSLNRNRADGVNYPEAVRELSAEHFEALGRDYLDMARPHRTERRPRFIDKMPNNFPAVGFLHLILPNATIIDARRHPLDACFGCFRQLFAKGQTFTYDLTDIGEYFLEYERMMDHWHAVLPGRVLTVQYEELVTDTDAQVRRLLDHCGLPFEEACLRFHETERPVRTASSEQVRQPIHTRSIGFWRNYESRLDELKEVLAPVLPRYARHLPAPP